MPVFRVLTLLAALFTVADGVGAQTVERVTGVNGSGSEDGSASDARFFRPFGVAVATDGTIFVADSNNFTLRRVLADGTTTTLAGLAGIPGSADGTGTAARFHFAEGVAVGPDGYVYVADTLNHAIRRVSPAGEVTTLAGTPGMAGFADGPVATSRFQAPSGLAMDERGTLYVTDRGNGLIRRIARDGEVSTVTGVRGQRGVVDGPNGVARLDWPHDLAVDDAGNLYFAEAFGHVVRKVTPWGHVTTFAGALNQPGTVDGVGPEARFAFPHGVAVDRAGNVYVSEQSGHVIRRITPAGTVTTVAGVAGVTGTTDGPALSARFAGPAALALLDDQTVHIADAGNNGIRRLGSLPPPVFTRYLSEGASTSFFDTRIALFNPGAVDTTATLTFQTGDGRNVPHVVPVAAGRRVTVRAADVPGLGDAEFSTVVTSGEPLVVDRAMQWGADGYGAHGEKAILAPSPIWYLAEGATHSGFSLFYLLQNPGDVPTTVRIRYLRTQGAPPLEKTYPLGPRSRTNVWVNVEEFDGLGAALASAEVSAEVQSLDGLPIIVERAMYRSTATHFVAGHESAGQTTPAPRWFLAEGATGPYFDLFVLIANPTDDPATARLSYLLDRGPTFTRDLVVPPNSRAGVWVDEEQFDRVPGKPLANVAVSTTVESVTGVPLIVERAMWWPGSSETWHEAHNSAGAPVTGTRWAIADGEVGPTNGAETYLLIANTSGASGAATVTLYFEDGSTLARDYVLAPRSRTNVAVVQDFGLPYLDRRFAAIVESTGTNPAQIVVERTVYTDAGGVRWASGRNALATRLR